MRYGTYDATRGLTILVAAGLAGLLRGVATQVGQTSTPRCWIEMGIVAAAGLVLALAHVLGGWTKGMRLRLSPGAFLLGFVPVLVCVGWVLMATQPGNGWHEGTIVSWSHDVGLMGLVHALGLWHGVLAFGFGLELGTTFDTVPAVAPAGATVVERRGGRGRRAVPVSDDGYTADEPVTAERHAVPADEDTRAIPTQRGRVNVGGRAPADRTPETLD